jgi:hypothetical protein
MNRQHYLVWIFVFLLLTIALTALYPRPGMIFFGAIATSILVFLQVFLILTSGDQSREAANEDWYEHQ